MIVLGVFLFFLIPKMFLVDKGFHLCSKGSGYYDLFIFQKVTFTECNMTVVGIIWKWSCGYGALFLPFMGCVSDQRLQNGVVSSF